MKQQIRRASVPPRNQASIFRARCPVGVRHLCSGVYLGPRFAAFVRHVFAAFVAGRPVTISTKFGKARNGWSTQQPGAAGLRMKRFRLNLCCLSEGLQR